MSHKFKTEKKRKKKKEKKNQPLCPLALPSCQPNSMPILQAIRAEQCSAVQCSTVPLS